MNHSLVTRYGWVAVLLAIVALWIRVEGGQIGRPPAAAADDSKPAEDSLKPGTIAVIDVAAVFKQDRAFNAEMSKIKAAIEEYDVYMKKQTAGLKEAGEQLKSAEAGSEEYRKLEALIARHSAALQAEVGLKKTEFLNAETKNYFDRYAKMQAAVKTIARQRQIDFVIRINSDEAKPSNRDSVLQSVNRAIVLHPQSHDITAAVIEELNRT